MENIKDNLRTAYDRNAAERDSNAKEPWKVAERQEFLSLLQQEHRRSLLELGAGPGTDSLFFQQQGLAVTALDLAPEMVRRCQAKGLLAFVMDYAELRFEPETFDAAYALNSLLHLPKRELPAVLQGIARVLKPGALFYLGVYGGTDFEGIKADDWCDPPRFFSFFRDEDLLSVVSAAFEVVSFKPITVGSADRLRFQSCVLRKPAS